MTTRNRVLVVVLGTLSVSAVEWITGHPTGLTIVTIFILSLFVASL